MIKINEERLLTDTPFVAVDLDRLERNIRRMADLSGAAGVKLRPHVKTHKSARIARMQIEAGAQGVTVAKLGEAEAMADAGIDDVLIAYPIVGRAKLQRFGELLQRIRLTVAIDDLAVAEGLNRVGAELCRRIPVYVDVDTGLHRMGRGVQDSADEILRIAECPFIEVRGLTSHAGHAYNFQQAGQIEAVAREDARMLSETQQRLMDKGLHVPEISVGATATARFVPGIPNVTEMRPGMYVYNDRTVMGAGGARLEDCAAVVVATIVSEEHGAVEADGACELEIGDVVQIVPNHICPVINLADQAYGFRNGVLEEVIKVDARGKNR